jgi:hypothetical protein
MTDSGNQKLANCFTFPTSALQMKVMAVVSVPRRPSPASEPNAALRVGVMGEAGDFKCLTFVKLKPRPVRKPGLFFRSPRSVLGSLATALRYLHLQAAPPETAAYSFCTNLTWCRWPAVAR